MRNWLSALIAGSDGRVDEAALFIASLGVMTIAAFVTLISLEVYVVIFRDRPFLPDDFATACATILAAGGTTAGIITAFIGTRNLCDKTGG